LTVPGLWSEEQELLQTLSIPTRDDLFDQELAEAAAQFEERAANE